MKIKLRDIRNISRSYHVGFSRWGRSSWKSCLPFWLNKRAWLIHRPDYVTTYHNDDGTMHHVSVHYLCGGLSTSREGMFEVVETVPDGRLLCAKCESEAKSRGLPSADEICGRHVCIGLMKPKRSCCDNANN